MHLYCKCKLPTASYALYTPSEGLFCTHFTQYKCVPCVHLVFVEFAAIAQCIPNVYNELR